MGPCRAVGDWKYLEEASNREYRFIYSALLSMLFSNVIDFFNRPYLGKSIFDIAVPFPQPFR